MNERTSAVIIISFDDGRPWRRFSDRLRSVIFD